MMVMKKWVEIVLAILILAVLLAGCGKQGVAMAGVGLGQELTNEETLVPIAGDVVQVVQGYGQIAVLRTDGTVRVAGDNSYHQREVTHWRDVVKVWADPFVTFGLTKDGKVLSTHRDYSHWENIADLFIFRGEFLDESNFLNIAVVGVKTDGTVVAAGYSGATNNLESPGYDFSDWKNIKDVLIWEDFVLGLSNDGTVYLTGDAAHDERGPIEVGWKNIKALYKDSYNVYALTEDDDVYVLNEYNFSHEALGWKDVESLEFAYSNMIYGITSSGTVLSAQFPEQEDSGFQDKVIPGLRDIKEVAAFMDNVMGLRKDGTVAVYPEDETGYFAYDPLWNPDDWTDIVKFKSNDGAVVALKNDGTLMYKIIPGDTLENDWENIADVWPIPGYLLALTKDGRLISDVVPEEVLSTLIADVQS